MTSISDGLDRPFFCQKTEKTRSMQEEMDGMVFISRQSRYFSFLDNMIKVIFFICTSNWRVNNYFSRQLKGINRRNVITTIFIKVGAS